MRRSIRLLAIAGLVAGVVGLEVSRQRSGAVWPLVPAPMHPLRGIATRYFNPFVVRLGLVGGRRSPWACIEHIGRRSGTIHRTPVLPRRIPDGYEIPLPYGADAHWVQNVLAAGHARLQVHETIFELAEPQIVGAADTQSLTRYERWRGSKLGYQYLRVRRTAEMPGTFSRWTGHEPVLTDGEPVPMPMEESPTASTSTDGVGAPETDTESEAAVDALARA
jgi:deazaflavin-dependent oxidoreductase (nitroreductase family)